MMRGQRHSHHHPRLFRRVFFHGLLLLVLSGLALGISSFVWNAGPWRGDLRRVQAVLVREARSALHDGAPLEARLQELSEATQVDLAAFDNKGKALAASDGPGIVPLARDELPRLDERKPIRRSREGIVFGFRLDEGHYLLARHRWNRTFGPLAAGGLLLLIVGALSFPLARSIARPLEKLSRAAEQLGRGDFSTRVELHGRDEIWQLGHAFNTMAARLEQLVRGERELLANVSHELRTPLARIRVALEMSEDPHVTTEAMKRYLAGIQSDIRELDGLLEELLTAARLDRSVGSGGIPVLHPTSFSWVELIQSEVKSAQERGSVIHLEMATPPADEAFSGDRTLLRRLVANLLDNALKYGATGRPILVRASQDTASALLRVENEGDPLEVAPEQLFEPFFRTAAAQSRSATGAGLGLYLCKRIAQAHGGTIAATSRAEGGISVEVALPLHEEPRRRTTHLAPM